MKKNCMNNHLRLLAFALLVVCCGSMQAQDDLLDYINSIVKKQPQQRRAGDGITVIDLSNYSAVVRERTLPITNGLRVRFINGTLSRANSLDGPILQIDAQSYVEISDGATVTTQQSTSNREAILMESGELRILSQGAVKGKNGYTSVLMTSDNDKFSMEPGSTLHEKLVCQASGASITFNGGYLKEDWDNNGYHFSTASDINVNSMPGNDVIKAELTGVSNVINLKSQFVPLFYLKAPAKTDGSTLIKVLVSGDDYLESTKQFTHWEGDSKYQIVKDGIARTIKILYDDLWHDIVWPWNPGPDDPCGCVWEDPIPIEVPCEGKRVKKDIEFPDDDLYWALYGRPENQEEEYDCEGEVDEGEHDVYIRPKAKVKWRWLRWRGCGCQGKHIWVWGTLRIYRVWYEYYWRFIHVMPGGRVEIEDMNGDCEETVIHVEGGEVDYGGDNSHCTGGKYGWYCTGGIIYIRGGYLSGGTCGGWTGTDGHSYHHGGTVHGGIHNYGIHYFYGGTCSGGGSYTIYNHSGGRFYYHGGTCTDGGKIWNEGDLYIDGGGSVNCGDIYCIRGGCIYILKKLTFTLRLIFTAENIVSGATVVVGGDGYKLTQEDIGRLQISLPDGYEWKYDSSCGCITIHETTGISNSKIEDQSVVKSYNVSGRQTKENTKGLNIQMMNDGSVKKAIVK